MGAAPANRFAAQAAPPHVGIVRGLPNTYEVDEYGHCYSTNPSAGWMRGQLERGAMQPFAPPPPVPMYDPTIIANPSWWASS